MLGKDAPSFAYQGACHVFSPSFSTVLCDDDRDLAHRLVAINASFVSQEGEVTLMLVLSAVLRVVPWAARLFLCCSD